MADRGSVDDMKELEKLYPRGVNFMPRTLSGIEGLSRILEQMMTIQETKRWDVELYAKTVNIRLKRRMWRLFWDRLFEKFAREELSGFEPVAGEGTSKARPKKRKLKVIFENPGGGIGVPRLVRPSPIKGSGHVWFQATQHERHVHNKLLYRALGRRAFRKEVLLECSADEQKIRKSYIESFRELEGFDVRWKGQVDSPDGNRRECTSDTRMGVLQLLERPFRVLIELEDRNEAVELSLDREHELDELLEDFKADKNSHIQRREAIRALDGKTFKFKLKRLRGGSDFYGKHHSLFYREEKGQFVVYSKRIYRSFRIPRFVSIINQKSSKNQSPLSSGASSPDTRGSLRGRFSLKGATRHELMSSAKFEKKDSQAETGATSGKRGRSRGHRQVKIHAKKALESMPMAGADRTQIIFKQARTPTTIEWMFSYGEEASIQSPKESLWKKSIKLLRGRKEVENGSTHGPTYTKYIKSEELWPLNGDSKKSPRMDPKKAMRMKEERGSIEDIFVDKYFGSPSVQDHVANLRREAQETRRKWEKRLQSILSYGFHTGVYMREDLMCSLLKLKATLQRTDPVLYRDIFIYGKGRAEITRFYHRIAALEKLEHQWWLALCFGLYLEKIIDDPCEPTCQITQPPEDVRGESWNGIPEKGFSDVPKLIRHLYAEDKASVKKLQERFGLEHWSEKDVVKAFGEGALNQLFHDIKRYSSFATIEANRHVMMDNGKWLKMQYESEGGIPKIPPYSFSVQLWAPLQAVPWEHREELETEVTAFRNAVQTHARSDYETTNPMTLKQPTGELDNTEEIVEPFADLETESESDHDGENSEEEISKYVAALSMF